MKVALIGNQNSGKSTLFNTLTGSNQKVGNWPGVTIEKKIGTIKNSRISIIDLPGIYSLKPYTNEEKITSDFIYNESIDIIINVIDCNSISRGLYLTMQLLELNKKVIIALNMYELAKEKGIIINEKKLSESLGGIPVIKISALSGDGCNTLISYIKNDKTINTNKAFNVQNQFCLKVDNNIEKSRCISELKRFEEKSNLDEIKRIEEKYRQIDNFIEKTTLKIEHINKRATLTDKLDKIFLNKYLAIPIFIAIMSTVYYASIEFVGRVATQRLNNSISLFSNILEKWLYTKEIAEPLISLLTNGIINGVSAVIGFLPQLTVLFIFLSFLEKVGYMSRISLIFDRLFRKIGMSGNSVVSFILGTGCSVPGIIATKTIKSEKEKNVTAVLTSFIPCSAKLPVISLFSTYFFRKNAGLVAVSFYMLSIIVIVLSAILFKKINKSFEENIYISELPEYRIPKFKSLLKDSINKIIDFIKRTGSVIILSSIVVWSLLSFSLELEYNVDIENSILASVGSAFSWIFIPIVGENSWGVFVSSVQGLIAKEQVISSMAIIAGLENNNISNSIFADGSPFSFFTPVSAYAYVCFNLFCAPCFAAISAMKKALGGNKKILKAVFYQYMIAYIISSLINFVGNRLI
ncbi:MAG: ferrous iron transport protein B [Clostridia bacterium]|nr:ferrous iron transport protein B [Clostridia bacterium]